MAAHGGPNIPTDGLVLCFDPSNPNCYSGTGNTCTELINGVNGTLYNGALVISENEGVVDFDGTDDYFRFDTNTNLDIKNNITFSCWFKFDVMDDTIYSHNIIRKGGATSTANFYYYIGGTYQYRGIRVLATIDGSWGGFIGSSSNILEEGLWYNHTWTFNNSGVGKSYVNYDYDQTTSTIARTELYTTTSTPIVLGSGNEIDGKIGIVSMWNRVLSDEEIKQNFVANRGRYGL